MGFLKLHWTVWAAFVVVFAMLFYFVCKFFDNYSKRDSRQDPKTADSEGQWSPKHEILLEELQPRFEEYQSKTIGYYVYLYAFDSELEPGRRDELINNHGDVMAKPTFVINDLLDDEDYLIFERVIEEFMKRENLSQNSELNMATLRLEEALSDRAQQTARAVVDEKLDMADSS